MLVGDWMTLVEFLRFDSLARGIVFSTAFSAIAAAFGFLASVGIAFFFGSQEGTDVYFFVISSISAVLSLLVLGPNSAIVIPHSMLLQEKYGHEESMHFLNMFMALYILVGMLVGCVFLVAPIAIVSFVSGLSVGVVKSQRLLLILSPVLLLVVLVSGHLLDILLSKRFFTISAIGGILNNVMLIAVLFALHGVLDESSLVVGAIVGYSIQIVLLAHMLKSTLGWKFVIRWRLPEKEILRNTFLAQSAYIASTLGAYLPFALFGAFGPGVITCYSLSQRLINLPHTFMVNQVSSVVGVRMNELGARGDHQEISSVLVATLKPLLFLLVPISLFVSLYSEEIIALTFKRGAFDENAVKTSAEFVRYLSLMLPLYALNTLVSRTFVACQKVAVLLRIQILTNILLAGATLIAVHFIGPVGFVWSLILAYVVAVGVYAFAMPNRTLSQGYLKVLGYLARVAFSCVLASAVVLLLRPFLTTSMILANLTIGSITFTFLTLLSNKLLGLENLLVSNARTWMYQMLGRSRE
jgi:putative peptidoglycan lipid II flippase